MVSGDAIVATSRISDQEEVDGWHKEVRQIEELLNVPMATVFLHVTVDFPLSSCAQNI